MIEPRRWQQYNSWQSSWCSYDKFIARVRLRIAPSSGCRPSKPTHLSRELPAGRYCELTLCHFIITHTESRIPFSLVINVTRTFKTFNNSVAFTHTIHLVTTVGPWISTHAGRTQTRRTIAYIKWLALHAPGTKVLQWF